MVRTICISYDYSGENLTFSTLMHKIIIFLALKLFTLVFSLAIEYSFFRDFDYHYCIHKPNMSFDGLIIKPSKINERFSQSFVE